MSNGVPTTTAALDPTVCKPTPLQSENDSARQGTVVMNKAADGSPLQSQGVQPAEMMPQEKQATAGGGASYQTRAAAAKPAAPPA